VAVVVASQPASCGLSLQNRLRRESLLSQNRLRREVCFCKTACIVSFVVAKRVAFPFSLDLGFQHVKDRFCGDSARHILECQERFDMDVAVRRF